MDPLGLNAPFLLLHARPESLLGAATRTPLLDNRKREREADDNKKLFCSQFKFFLSFMFMLAAKATVLRGYSLSAPFHHPSSSPPNNSSFKFKKEKDNEKKAETKQKKGGGIKCRKNRGKERKMAKTYRKERKAKARGD